MAFSEKSIKTIVSVFKIIELVGAVVFGLGLLVYLIFSRYEQLPLALCGFLASVSIYYGLLRRKNWVVPVILFLRAFTIIGLLFSSAPTLVFVIARTVGMGLAIFTIYFFTRKEVRKYFKVKSAMIFSR